jgi:NADH dehydrogenase FAD-containing subunit
LPYIGAVGIEMAAELKLVCPQQKVTLIHSREHLLSSEPLPDDFKIRTLDVLKETGVEIILGARVNSTTEVKSENGSVHYKISLSNGSEVTTGEVIWAVSKSIPSSGYLPEAALDKEGYVKIGPT